MEQLLSPDFDLDSLGLNFESEGFGPAGSNFDFKDQFDGKLFKPYNKKEKLGKLCDFAASVQATNYQQNRQPDPRAIKKETEDSKQSMVDNDSGFTVVEEKKVKDNDRTGHSRRDKNAQSTQIHTGKLQAQRSEDKKGFEKNQSF